MNLSLENYALCVSMDALQKTLITNGKIYEITDEDSEYIYVRCNNRGRVGFYHSKFIRLSKLFTKEELERIQAIP